MRRISFDKCEGCGNDYVYVRLSRQAAEDAAFVRAHAPAIAREVSDRHFGIGSDGLILIDQDIAGDPASEAAAGDSDEPADARMIMYNADGSRGSMCGNALRCIGRILDLAIEGEAGGKTRVASYRVQTDAGMRVVQVRGSSVEVGMGMPQVDFELVPMRSECVRVLRDPRASSAGPGEVEIELPPEFGCGPELRAMVLSMGNPHCVVFLDAEGNAGLGEAFARDAVAATERIGRFLETHECFPEGANVEFVRRGPDGLVQRTWERGSGETFACGSGACAVALAACARGLVPPGEFVTIELLGGRLEICVDADVRMRGPARVVFSGSFGVRDSGGPCYDGFAPIVG